MLQKKKIIKFLFSGGMAAATEYGVFLLLSFFGVTLIVANSTSFISGLLVSFSLNRTWVFGSKDNKNKQFVAYLILAIINLALSNILVAYLTNSQDIDQRVAKITIMILIATWNYVIFSKLIFRNKNST